MSERVNASERSMQRLLSEVRWDDAGVAAEYRRTMQIATADPSGILVLDDTGFPKKGRDSVCVARQYLRCYGQNRQLPDWRKHDICRLRCGLALHDGAFHPGIMGPGRQ
jgi:SRSO17 transposase